MSSLKLPSLEGEKKQVTEEVNRFIEENGFNVIARDHDRPWGGFFVIDENQAEKFGAMFFPGIEISSLKVEGGKLSPKILLVQPGTRLSWQYHHRRQEIWKMAAGKAGLVVSDTDEEGPVKELQVGEIVRLRKGERHRLVGLDGWGMIAEIWQHTDPNHPSDEEDIVRVQDDFGR